MTLKNEQLPVLILGGTGHYGRHIVRSLLNKNYPVRVLSRDKNKAQKLLGEQVEVITGDIIEKQSIVKAIDGIDRIVISVSAFSPKLIRQLRLIERDSVLRVLEESQKANISRIVFLSAYELRLDLITKLKFEIGKIKLDVETNITKSSFNWTILGEAFSMEMFFSMIRGTRMMVPGGGHSAIPTVSALDVGEIAAQAILRDNLACKRIRVTGPEAITFPEAARRVSDVLGRTVKHYKIPLLPLRIIAKSSRYVFPYLSHFVAAVKLMNCFPQDLVDQVPQDHQWLRNNFDYAPNSFEEEARSRFKC